MGLYINTGKDGFSRARKSEYIDKSELIAFINDTLFTERSFTCVTRCRRFGKSMAARMLCAYYDHSCDSRSLFEDLQIAKAPSYEEHLNQYPVIYLDLSDFVSKFHDDDIVGILEKKLRTEILEVYPNVEVKESDDLMDCLVRIVEKTGQHFVFIIDEWDAICREFKPGTQAMDRYVEWLRRMFKGMNASRVFAGVYMTGILPVKKYNTQSALNNFQEYSMVDPGGLAGFFGFTKEEVRALAQKYGMDYDELEKWYDGYQIGDVKSLFNPNSVIQAVTRRKCKSYWARTAAYDTVSTYISMNFKGLKDDIIRMLAGGRSLVDPAGFQNDLSVIEDRDDALTVLVHLGYLSFDWNKEECYIPNREVTGEMVRAVKSTNWMNVVDTLEQSRHLLQATLDGDEEAVARGIDIAHDENTSILSYNDENSLSCVLSIAYIYARNDYVIHRELASGKGFADLVLIPRKNVDSPALVIELKYNKDADSAIDQIKRKRYTSKVAQHTDNLILVGINYNRDTKQHECHIERMKHN
ncbi:MAG: AAA family ATPase [Prevotella sp.]|nr:AAA family ATPase [Prevotella sp.]